MCFAILIFTSKLHDPPPQQNYPPPHTKIKISASTSKEFFEILNPHFLSLAEGGGGGGGVHAMKSSLFLKHSQWE